ncbi:MAG: hypothetical protein OXG37_08940 [Actinomycetia bacterium]|nr:hypothetical protein [Actinomycetes bacterium]
MDADRPQDRPRLAPGARRPPRKVPLSIGAVLSEAWRLYTRFLGRFVLIAAVVFAVLSLIQVAVDASDDFGVAIAAFAANIVGIYWLQGALVVAVDDARRGRPDLTLGQIFRKVEPFLWTLIGVGVIVAVAVVCGLILLIVPRLVMLTFWSLATAVVVLEGASIRTALQRSWALVSGNALRVFAVIVITIVLAAVVSVVVAAILRPLPDVVDVYVANVVASSVSVPFVALAWTIMYFELKLNEEFAAGS